MQNIIVATLDQNRLKEGVWRPVGRDGVLDQSSDGRCGKNTLDSEYTLKVGPVTFSDDSDVYNTLPHPYLSICLSTF